MKHFVNSELIMLTILKCIMMKLKFEQHWHAATYHYYISSRLSILNQWNGIVDCNTGMEYWNGLNCV